jgi:hypothetical protein
MPGRVCARVRVRLRVSLRVYVTVPGGAVGYHRQSRKRGAEAFAVDRQKL